LGDLIKTTFLHCTITNKAIINHSHRLRNKQAATGVTRWALFKISHDPEVNPFASIRGSWEQETSLKPTSWKSSNLSKLVSKISSCVTAKQIKFLSMLANHLLWEARADSCTTPDVALLCGIDQ